MLAVGQKNRRVTGIVTSISSPLTSFTFAVMSISGCISWIYFLKANESTDKNSLSTNLFMNETSVLPSTEIIVFLNLVVKSVETFLLTFFIALTSSSITASSCPLGNLNFISLFEFGSLKSNSLIPLGCLLRSIFLLDSCVKSTDCSTPPY